MPRPQAVPSANLRQAARTKLPAGEEKRNWRDWLQDYRGAMANVPAAFRLSWNSDKRGTLLMMLCTLIGAVLPASQAYTAKLIIDGVVKAVNQGLGTDVGLRSVLPYVGLEFGLMLIGTLNTQARALVEHILHARMDWYINSSIIRKALALDLSFFENAEYYDKLQKAQREADWRTLQLITQLFFSVQNVITLLSYAGLLFVFSPWLVVLVFGTTLPLFLIQSRYARLNFRLLSWRAPEARQVNYLTWILTIDQFAKEVKLFGLGEPLLKRYSDLFWKFFKEDTALNVRRSISGVWWSVVGALTYYASFAWIVARAAGGLISLGSMTLYIQVFRSSQATFQALFQGLSSLYENGLFMSNLFGFLELEPLMPLSEHPIPAPKPIRQGIEFRNVSFKYPGKADYALKNVNLTIHPGEKLALVGANGAGKTTLIKLLTRLYDPSEGEVLLDNVDLREYDLDSLRQRIGVIFQDFAHYQMRVRDNIGFGQIEDYENMARITDSAERAGAVPVIEGLPQGYETQLGNWWNEGRELSGGEWQKIGLARAFMRDSEVLVLDEPTAALDAQAEYEVFQRFRELTSGRIAVLISHRFSTVRMADRIAVIKDGTVSELGSHAELLALGGTYAHLFNIQAEGYR